MFFVIKKCIGIFYICLCYREDCYFVFEEDVIIIDKIMYIWWLEG